MSLLAANSLTLRIAGRTLLHKVDFCVNKKQKIGLVGQNGSGKSTFLSAIAGEIQPDEGNIRIRDQIRLAWIKQETPSGNLSLLETVLAGDTERTHLLEKANNTDDPAILSNIYERLRIIKSDSAPSRASMILTGLGFNFTAQACPISSFSGGWRMRVALAVALFVEPDLLLLDEPSNHLDLEATLWLQSWLRNFRGAVLAVSHDRDLLNNSVDSIAWLDRKKITVTPGGYEEFIKIRLERVLNQSRLARRVEAQRTHIQSFIDRFRSKASKARQAQARIKALAKLPPIEISSDDNNITIFSFLNPDNLPAPLLTLNQATVGYGNKVILSNLSFRLDMGDRIALLGPNGNGKSTFAKLLAGRLSPSAGKRWCHARMKVGYFAQYQNDELITNASPLTHLAQLLPQATVTELKSHLARFGLDKSRADTVLTSLSGGEKARLLLALSTYNAPHLLILDEPTNHLDMDARNALVRALTDYKGTVILISHDAGLVELIADRFWLVANNTVCEFDGDMAAYRSWVINSLQQIKKTDAQDKADTKQIRNFRISKRNHVNQIRKNILTFESQIEKLEKKKVSLEEQLCNCKLYQQKHKQEIDNIQSKLHNIINELKEVEDKWMSAITDLEQKES